MIVAIVLQTHQVASVDCDQNGRTGHLVGIVEQRLRESLITAMAQFVAEDKIGASIAVTNI